MRRCVVWFVIARLGSRRQCGRIEHIEDPCLVTGNCHQHEIGHQSMTLRDEIGFESRLDIVRLRHDDTSLPRVGFLELQIETALEIAKTCEILVETLAVFDTNLPVQFSGLVKNRGQRTLADHDFRVGRERIGVGILEVRAKQALVETDR